MKIIFSIFTLLTVFCTLSFSSGQEEAIGNTLLARRGISLPPLAMEDEPKGAHPSKKRRHSSSATKEQVGAAPVRRSSSGRRPPLSPIPISVLNSLPFEQEGKKEENPFSFSSAKETPSKPPYPTELFNLSSDAPLSRASRQLQISREPTWAPTTKEEYDRWYADQIAFQNTGALLYPSCGHLVDVTSSSKTKDSGNYWDDFP